MPDEFKIERNLGRGLPDLTEGQIVTAGKEVDEATLKGLQAQGLASPLKAVPVEPLKGTPPKEKAIEADDKSKEKAKAASSSDTSKSNQAK